MVLMNQKIQMKKIISLFSNKQSIFIYLGLFIQFIGTPFISWFIGRSAKDNSILKQVCIILVLTFIISLMNYLIIETAVKEFINGRKKKDEE